MLLTIKNKTLIGIDRSIEAANKQPGAIINEVEIDTAELFNLIREIEITEDDEQRKDIRSRFRVKSTDNTASIFDFFNLSFNFVEKWVKREYIVTYRGERLQLVRHHRKHL